MNSNTKKLLALIQIITLAILVLVPTPAYADILSDVKSAQGSGAVDAVTQSAQEAGESVVRSLRTIAVVVAVVMFIIVAYGLLFSPNVKTIADMKGRVGALILAIVIAFMAEKIVGTVFSWLGIQI